MLVKALHRAHEKIEDLLSQKKLALQQLEQANKRLKFILNSVPGHFHYARLESSEFNDRQGVRNILLSFKDLAINDIWLTDFSVRLRIDNNGTSVFIAHNDKHQSALLNFVRKESTTVEEFACTVDSSKNESAERLSNLSTSTWTTLISLMNMLKSIFLEPPEHIKSLIIDHKKIAGDIANHIQTYERWPSTLRYDELSIENISHGEVYHSMEIKLTNLSVSNSIYKELIFVLSTVDNEMTSFGSNPRLEFSHTPDHAIENWHEALTNGYTPKLELRFAAPNAVDTQVWGSLSSRDKILIAGIIGKLPNFIQQLMNSSAHLSLRWQDWQSLAEDVKNIFIQNMFDQRKPIHRKKNHKVS